MSAKPSVRRSRPPTASLIANLYRDADLLDSYMVDLPVSAASNLRSLVEQGLGKPPLWFRMLLRLRDMLVHPFGIKTSTQIRSAGPAERRIDFFPVLAVEKHELILGEDDIHLDFRLALQWTQAAGGSRLTATTVVHTHNRLGRAYIRVIEPFHPVVVKRMLRNIAVTAARVDRVQPRRY